MIRLPVVAGTFYPFEHEPLLNIVEKLFGKIKDVQQNCKIVISPHAGYEFSGRTAAMAIASLLPLKKFIILGPNHFLRGKDFAVPSSETNAWQTPLGDCSIDKELRRKILNCKIVNEDDKAHEREHSVEVQLPLLQYRFKDFSFVPISIMNVDYSKEFLNSCKILGDFISEIMKEPIGLIASSDFSHYVPLEVARDRDKAAIAQIEKLDIENFFEVLDKTEASICGYGPIAVAMVVAKRFGLKPRLIHSSTSADATGDKGSVVSYHAIGFS